jgi:hypothetical protein
MTAQINRAADSKQHPDGIVTAPHYASLKMTAACGAFTILGSPAIVTDADAWTAGISNGIGVSATGGSFTIARAGQYRVDYTLSDITIVTTQVDTVEVYVGTTASGGKCKITQLTGSAPMLAGSVILTLAANDVVTLKVTVATADNFTCAAGQFSIQEL